MISFVLLILGALYCLCFVLRFLGFVSRRATGLVCWLSDCGVLVCPILLHVYARVFSRCFFPWDLISDYILVMAFFFLQLVACLRKERDVIIFCSTWFVLFNVLLLICA
jgi:hypothetical protein